MPIRFTHTHTHTNTHIYTHTHTYRMTRDHLNAISSACCTNRSRFLKLRHKNGEESGGDIYDNNHRPIPLGAASIFFLLYLLSYYYFIFFFLLFSGFCFCFFQFYVFNNFVALAFTQESLRWRPIWNILKNLKEKKNKKKSLKKFKNKKFKTKKNTITLIMMMIIIIKFKRLKKKTWCIGISP